MLSIGVGSRGRTRTGGRSNWHLRISRNDPRDEVEDQDRPSFQRENWVFRRGDAANRALLEQRCIARVPIGEIYVGAFNQAP
jgi:hypothetical protein